MIALLAAAAMSFAVLAVAFVPLERAFPARPGQRILRRDLPIDACFFLGQYLAFTGLSISALTKASSTIAASHVARLAEAIPVAPRIVLAVLAGDVLVYWFHRACHRFEFLWRFHAIHHSSEELDWLAAHREHPVDGVLTQLCQNLPAFLLAAPLGSIAWLAAFRGMWAVFVHSNVRLPLGPLRYVLGAPELHHWHHAKPSCRPAAPSTDAWRDGPEATKSPRTLHNFANLAPWIDVVFGTHHLPELPETFELGIDEPHPRGYFAQLAVPFAKLGAPIAAAIGALGLRRRPSAPA